MDDSCIDVEFGDDEIGEVWWRPPEHLRGKLMSLPEHVRVTLLRVVGTHMQAQMILSINALNLGEEAAEALQMMTDTYHELNRKLLARYEN